MGVDVLNGNGHITYCNLFDPVFDKLIEQNNVKALFQQALDALLDSEVIIAIVSSPKRSVGQIMEVGIALSRDKPFHLFENTNAKDSTYLPKLATETYEWTTEIELEMLLAKI